MPSPIRSLTVDAIRRFVSDETFAPRATGRVGVELEWVTVAHRPGQALEPDTLRAMLPDPLPGRSRLTFEPGGQLELSGPVHRDLHDACGSMAADTAIVADALGAHGVDLVGVGLDPHGPRERVVDTPRYRAMEEYFDQRWPAGRTMMRNTASIQVNLDLGTNGDVDTRWARAHHLGPMLAASFANSPFDTYGRPTGWRSTRLAVWNAIDPDRTAPAHDPGVDAASAWTRYALDAPVMMIRVDDDGAVPVRRPLPFRQWIEEGHELGWPTLDDFCFHLTTLFPPVRPRGWLELRMIDALPGDWWPAAVSVTKALLDDPEAAEIAAEAVAPVRGQWAIAARQALADPAMHRAADRCFAAALDALPRLGAHDSIVATTAAFHDRYVARRRCPADERMTEWAKLQAATA